MANHAVKAEGLRGVVSGVRVVRGGSVSVTVIFQASDAHNALLMAVGMPVAVSK